VLCPKEKLHKPGFRRLPILPYEPFPFQTPFPFRRRSLISRSSATVSSSAHLVLHRRRPRRRRIPSLPTIRRLRRLHLHTVLLAIVSLVRSSSAATIVPSVAIRRVAVVVVVGAVRWCRCSVVLAAVIGCRGIVVVAWARSPACAVEGLAAGLAALAGGEATRVC
jgi:hypothetical protein